LIVQRYILRRVLAHFASVTIVLFGIVIVLQFTRVLARAAADRFPFDLFLSLVTWGAAQNVSIILPIGLLIGIVLALGRLHEDHEMAAMAACGVPSSSVVLPVLLVVTITATSLGWLSIVYNPKAAAQVDTDKRLALQLGSYANLRPGEFRSFESAGLVVYARDVTESGELLGLFVDRVVQDKETVIVATRGRIQRNPDRTPAAILLDDGTYYDVASQTPRQSYMHFGELRIPIQQPVLGGASTRLDALPTATLLSSDRLPEVAEWHTRMAWPVMALMLGAIAVPLSRLRPRQGRYGRAALAIFIYFVYANLLTAGGTWLASGRTPAWAGLWWVHALVGATALATVALSRWPRGRQLARKLSLAGFA
jgi:lipopolysaccharide export system permease protein